MGNGKVGPITGSCQCKTVQYEIDGLDQPVSYCHCETCRKTHAAPMVPTAGVLREHFRWLQGREKLSSFESSPGKLRHFCSVCGAHLMAERDGGSHVILRVATLDADPGVLPVAHIWTSCDQSWLAWDDAVSYAEWQPGR